ncbi:hypothetical protein [Acinetobacter nosocomialis]|uniref:hypothetical protein n=1 Tax=Acinetobacter nosocomialis TaxID=106654 RepID=UPI00280EFF4E|nr:hypothetical protein [Acinetobacter nosocomialis]MDQ9028058.1 hypothetical protein [Acinetobacter nosocomialis]MDQ9045334.1 hypothetical protein [Acinetobacter nosocomialis]MDQ9082755.1 hypothetical protein [Acinetobacter nosocomialis]
MERNEYQQDKYRKFIYSSKRRIQRRVLQLEKLTAEAIHNYIHLNYKDEWFESNFSILSCWKFSKKDFDNTEKFWCDAISFEDFHIEKERVFTFNGHAWIGLVNNVGSEWKVPVSGKFFISSNGKTLKSYTLTFYNESQELVLSKRN